MKILIVDDSRTKIQSIKTVISETHIKYISIIEVGNAADAFTAILNDGPFDLMILDLNLPLRKKEMPNSKGGVQLLKELTRRNEKNKPKHVIGLTAFDKIKEQDLNAFAENGGWAILTFKQEESQWQTAIKTKIQLINEQDGAVSTKDDIAPDTIRVGDKDQKVERIFISYSRKDNEFMQELKLHLKPFENSKIMSTWYCEDIKAGKWHEQIQTELEKSTIYIFMVSAGFMASEYAINDEVEIAIQLAEKDASKKILGVLVKECAWQNWGILGRKFDVMRGSELTSYQFLPYSEYKGQSSLVALEEWGSNGHASRNVAYKQIVDRILSLIED